MADSEPPPPPSLVLSVLREFLEPTPITRRLPNILQLAAHLTLVGQQISHEAAWLIGTLSEQPVNRKQMQALQCLAARDNDELVHLSLEMRRSQLLGSLAKGEIIRALIAGTQDQMDKALAKLKNLNALVDDRYFPPVDTLKQARDRHQQIYVHVMPEDLLPNMRAHREEISTLLGKIEKGGNPVIPVHKSLKTLGREMLVQAEKVVKDADELMAMFPREKGKKRARDSLPAQNTDEHPRKRAPRKTMPARVAQSDSATALT